MTYAEWRGFYPEAAYHLESMLEYSKALVDVEGQSESRAQQLARFQIAKSGAMSWRNNVGATPAKETHICPACKFHYETHKQPVRYGLANDSSAMNKKIKSSDLILCIPRKITPNMVGQIIGQFGAIEVKKPGFIFNPKDEHQAAQAQWLQLITSLGGYASFSTGEVIL
jgi:hypothetical protein